MGELYVGGQNISRTPSTIRLSVTQDPFEALSVTLCASDILSCVFRRLAEPLNFTVKHMMQVVCTPYLVSCLSLCNTTRERCLDACFILVVAVSTCYGYG